jgi:hypothetical protein
MSGNESEARRREREAWDARYTHGKASRTWEEELDAPPPAREAETCTCEWSPGGPVADHLSWCPLSEPRTP